MTNGSFPDPLSITTRAEFASFVERLRLNLATQPEDWENPTLPTFLEALSAYATDVVGYIHNSNSTINPELPSWQLFALILAGARIYE